MSGFSDGTNCPNCGEQANRYSDHKPYDFVSIDCMHCGFYTNTSVHQMTLEELNIMRADNELEPLKELPEFNKERF